MKNILAVVGAVLGGLLVLGAVIVAIGKVDVAADTPHSAAVFKVLETARERSIDARSDDIQVPDLTDAAMIRRGAGNYDSMCAGCHLSPGAADTELSRGLYPEPPSLSRGAAGPARAFWVIKHGIKATGMPAWGKSMEDHYIWDMVAFLEQLPAMTAGQYAAEVAASGGHSHGGNETTDHQHSDAEEPAHTHDDAKLSRGGDASDGHSPESQPEPKKHVHADGKEHVHQ